MKLRVPVLSLAACCLALSGCGGDSEAAKSKEADASTAGAAALADAKAVVVDYFTAAFAGDAAACEHESATYAAEMNEENGTKDCAERIESVKAMLTDGEPLLDVSKSVVEVSAGEQGGVVAEVTHELDGFGGTYLLVVEEGSWVIDGEVAGADDGGDTGFGDARQVSEDELLEVAKKFCAVEPGVSRTEVEKWLGEPTGEKVDDDGTIEVDWFLNDDMYTVWFDDQEKVTQSSGSSPREGDPCA